MTDSLVTIAVPSYNQGAYLEDALISIFAQKIPADVFVVDGGSTDNSLEIIQKWAPRLAGWRSHPDEGQASAINEVLSHSNTRYVCWLNSDDLLLQDGLSTLINVLDKNPDSPAAYGCAWNMDQSSGKYFPVKVEPFSEKRLAFRCIISQPSTLIRKTAWDDVGGLDESLHMSMDYDLWWKLFRKFGPLTFVDKYIAVNRVHDETKTRLNRFLHYKESISIVRKYHGRVPLKWWLAQPYSVWYKSIFK